MAGTTNMQQWNPQSANQETDAQYTADSARAGGAANTSVFMSMTANKMFYQLSTYITALCQAFANKGYSTSDASLNALTAVCANFLTEADLPNQLVNVAYAPTVVLDASNATGFYLNLSGPMTIAGITGLSPGQLVILYYAQNAVGGWGVSFPYNVVGAMAPTPTPNMVSMQVFRYNPYSGLVLVESPLMSGSAQAWLQTLAAGTTGGGPILQATQQGVNYGSSPTTAAITAITQGGGVNNYLFGGMNQNGTSVFYVRADGLISGSSLTVSGSISGANLSVTGPITGASLAVSGPMTGASLAANGAVTGASLAVTGAMTGASLAVTGAIAGASLAVTAPAGSILVSNGATMVPRTRTLVNQLPSRAFNATYTNTSAGPLFVTGYGLTDLGTTASIVCYVNGNPVWANEFTATVSNGYAGFSFEVPYGATYEVVVSGGIYTLSQWFENTYI